MLLSVVIPARNEAKNILVTVKDIIAVLTREGVDFEIIVIDDYSRDETGGVLGGQKDRRVRCVKNSYPPGFGFAIRAGLDVFRGDAVVIVMADGSDAPQDIVKYYNKLQEGYDCVFGTRFSRASKVVNYPFLKLFLNRLGNWLIKILFWLPFNDITNAFKGYRREAIEGISPLLSCHFNLTVEMPLKAIVRRYSWVSVPINWYGRKKGHSKWAIKELGSKYLFIIIYVWLEKMLSKGDYRKGKYWLRKKAGLAGKQEGSDDSLASKEAEAEHFMPCE